jgi:sec-independent protein translocase protein TatA
MANVGPLEVLVVLVIALVVFGPKRLPELGQSLGRGIREFKASLSGLNEGSDQSEEPAALEPSEQPGAPAANPGSEPQATKTTT